MLDSIYGAILLFFSMILQVIIPPLPAELIVIAASKIFGVPLTAAVAGTGLWIGSVLVYYIGRYLHQRFDGFFGKERIRKAIEEIRNYENFILWVRILPYNPSDIISYAAGIIKVNNKKFITISFFTSYARCFMLAYLGSVIISFKMVFLVLSILLTSAIVAHYLTTRKK